LRGEESKQRKRALGLLSGIALLFVALALLAVRFEKSAKEQGLIAESRSLAAKAEQTVEQDQPAALDLAIRSWLKAKTPEARLAVAHAFLQPEWLEGHAAEVRHAAFSPDGQRVVTASDDHTAQVWNAALGRLLVKLEGHSGSVVSAVFSPDGQRIVSASEDHTARVWNAAKGELLATLQGHEDGFWAAHPVFSRSGDRIVIADNDGAAWMLNAVKGQVLAKLEGHAAGRVNVEFSPDGHSIVTASPDKTARVYRLLKLSDISALLAK
jgi:ligand-binding sensor domain-containing protein